MKKKLLLIASLIGLSFAITACGNEETKSDPFREYHFGSDNRVFQTSIGTEYVIDYMAKEENAHEPKVVYSLWIGNTEPAEKIYNWCQMSVEERKADLRECGEMVIDYTKDKGWDNDYYLYININSIYNGQNLVYDYESDSLYIPTTESIFMEMYEKFGTMSCRKLEEIDGGIDFLLNNNLAQMKHNEIEYKTLHLSGVQIYDGKFSNFIEFDECDIY